MDVLEITYCRFRPDYHDSISFFRSSTVEYSPLLIASSPFRTLSITYRRYIISSIPAESGSLAIALIASCFKVSIILIPSKSNMGSVRNSSINKYYIMQGHYQYLNSSDLISIASLICADQHLVHCGISSVPGLRSASLPFSATCECWAYGCLLVPG